jgi:hypothetical protein
MPSTTDPKVNRQIARLNDLHAMAELATRSGWYLAASHYRAKADRLESRILATMEGGTR